MHFCIAQTPWVAFNDHATGSGTHPNATRYHVLGHEAGTNGPLKEVHWGTNLPITLFLTTSGAPIPDPAGAEPAPDTPLFEMFAGYVDFSSALSNNVAIPSGVTVTFTVSGLDPARRYWLTLGAVRGRANTTNRWTLLALNGAEEFTNAHSGGILTTSTVPGLTANQAAANFAINNTPATGDQVQWRGINPGPDGQITVVGAKYIGTVPGGSSAGTVGYAPTGLRLREDTFYAPAIYSQPADQTNRLGDNAVFEVGAAGDELAYQWYRDGTPLLGATQSTLVLSNIYWNDFGTLVSVTVSNSADVVWSDPATLWPVRPAIVITAQPKDATNFVWTDAEFHVEAQGDELFYQWYRNAMPLPDATNATLVLAKVPWENNGAVVSVRMTNRLDAAWSSNATLTLTIPTQYLVPMDGLWRYHPATNTIPANWKDLDFDARDWPVGVAPIGFATGLPTPLGTVLPDEGWRTYLFRFEFEHAFPVEADLFQAMLTHLTDDGVIFYLNGQQVYRRHVPDSPVTFDTQASWFVGTAAYETVTLGTAALREGRNVLAAEVHQVGAIPDGDMVLNAAIEAEYRQHVPLTLVYEPQDVSVKQYFLVRLYTLVNGFGASYQWYKNGDPIPGATDPSLYFARAEPSDSGLYHAVVTNRASRIVSRQATVNVIPGLPAIIVQGMSNLTVMVGTQIDWGPWVGGDEPFYIGWIKDGKPILGTPFPYPITSLDQFATLNLAGQYQVLVTNLYGSALSQPATLTVLPNPNARLGPGTVDLNFAAHYAHHVPSCLYAFPDGRVLYGSDTAGPPLVRVLWDGFVDETWNLEDSSHLIIPVSSPMGFIRQPWAVYPDGSVLVAQPGLDPGIDF